ncbi:MULTISPECIES: class I SAM-dependent methyltransferase [unclassified Virgibacillus]|uniref:class I SAM-dependent methyltransferase n=1 Tax=unclassified Virgibacillus TaxID=2620237 RepID=UPI0024DE8890|nr:class I SAM-dependent methyltransferase [Virgibacillus sp. LDC-1]
MDFHDKRNKSTYTTRNADQSWIKVIQDLIPINRITNAVDIGCGGGIYAKALSDMGINLITGVDFSEQILEGASYNCRNHDNIILKHGNALETGLASNSYELVLERALIHHIDDLNKGFSEVNRILQKEGFFIIQDRTLEDCLLEGSENHIRGYFFDCFPRLAAFERSRRHRSIDVIQALEESGFIEIEEVSQWETRAVYENNDQLKMDLLARTGRSILHELTDEELAQLIFHIDTVLDSSKKIVEKDRWTIWTARKK